MLNDRLPKSFGVALTAFAVMALASCSGGNAAPQVVQTTSPAATSASGPASATAPGAASVGVTPATSASGEPAAVATTAAVAAPSPEATAAAPVAPAASASGEPATAAPVAPAAQTTIEPGVAATAVTATAAPTEAQSSAPAAAVPGAAPQAAATAAAPVAQTTPVCTPGALTPALTEGPYYKANPPQVSSLYQPGMAGTKLTLTGYVLDANCQPVPGARVDFWQADSSGHYDNSGYTLRGYQITDAEGRYTVETVVPGLYPGRTEHIHVKVTPPNGQTLTTQLFFPGVAQNNSDGIFAPQNVLNVNKASGGLTATFSFVVQR